MIDPQRQAIQEIGIADIFQAFRKYAGVVIGITVFGLAIGLVTAKLLPTKYGYSALLKMGQAAHIRDDATYSLHPLADPLELRGYITFLGGSADVAPPGASIKSVEILKSPVSDAMTMLLISAQGTTLEDAEKLLQQILHLIQKRYEEQVNQKRASYVSQGKYLETKHAGLQTTVDLINSKILSVRDPVASLTLLLHKRAMIADMEKLSEEMDRLGQASSPTVTYNFDYVEVRPISKDPIAPQTRKIIFLSGIFGLLIGCLTAFGLSVLGKKQN